MQHTPEKFKEFAVMASRNNRCKGGIKILDDFKFRYFLLYGKVESTACLTDKDGMVLMRFIMLPRCTDIKKSECCSKCAIGRFVPKRYCRVIHCGLGKYLATIDEIIEDI